MSRTHLIKIEDGKTKDFYAEFVKKDDDIHLQLFDSETSKNYKIEYDLTKSLPSLGTTATSICLLTPYYNISFVFDSQNDKNTFLKIMNSASLQKKDNDCCSNLINKMENNYIFPINGLYTNC